MPNNLVCVVSDYCEISYDQKQQTTSHHFSETTVIPKPTDFQRGLSTSQF